MKTGNSKKTTAFGLALFTMILGGLCFSAEAQQPAKSPRIGFLALSRSVVSARVEAFRQGLRDLGYVEGKNIVIEYRWTEGQLDRLPDLASELVRLKVDVIVTAGPQATRSAKEATSTLPVVMGFDNDPVGSGLVASLARPGGNLTGFTRIAAGLAGKRLEVLKQTIAELSRVSVLWHPGNPGSEAIWKESQAPAQALGLKLHSLAVGNAGQLESGFQEALKTDSAALFVTVSALITSNRKRIAELAIKNRLPAIYERREFVESGGLMSYGADQNEPYRRAAVFVDKILKGVKP
ncbi:MAG TPA: ABC transporter substrate-binding protein, partial [Candidatus Binatia bacterium]|nr:ABC transporter substrate-binding protein [Candidatus Binatia bacterium]